MVMAGGMCAVCGSDWGREFELTRLLPYANGCTREDGRDALCHGG